MITTCPNCESKLQANSAFCPNCGHDLRKLETAKLEDSTTHVHAKTSTQSKFGTPSASLWISFVVGTIVLESIYGHYKLFAEPNANYGSLLGLVVGSGLGFLLVVLIPTTVISLIIYVIRKKFPDKEFTSMIYIFTIILSIFFLSAQ